ncbi:MAG: crotonase/enoyl-CoA hydratase family protein [Kofleriaceae bacterium]|jgi:enoyl-CoA hydratase|nr:crotonase/enoyl-CoA hydratase family protein [Kofleriaceae bacterium]MBP9171549.1 crotonase/enoyl-CoA hydratase family protein [Kofleriaceae bacterium]MBP9860196.1 crotonase/enoyl-CoA hydratase family protein [Kofleriaceae bacterium]
MDLLARSRHDDIVTVTLTIPTMTPAFFAACGQTFTELAADASVRAIVIRSTAPSFSFGLDLPAAMAAWGKVMTGGGLAGARSELLTLIRELQRSFTAIASCPAPVIAAIHGKCLGGGVDLIAACDLRVCSADAVFSVRETKVAIVADLGSLQRLPHIIGPAATRELALTGKDVDAARALALGLVGEVAADRDGAWAAADRLAREIAGNPPLVVRGVKQVLDYGAGKSVADGLEYVAAWNAAFLASEDLGEAMAAFAGKRPPAFRGR